MNIFNNPRDVTFTIGGEKFKGVLTKGLEMANEEKYIPKVGENCILQSYGFTEFPKEVRIDYMGKKVGCYTTLKNGEDYTFAIKDVVFRPIPTKADVEREQLNRILCEVYVCGTDYKVKAIQKAGFTIPKKVKRSDVSDIITLYLPSGFGSGNNLTNDICNLLGDLVENDQ